MKSRTGKILFYAMVFMLASTLLARAFFFGPGGGDGFFGGDDMGTVGPPIEPGDALLLEDGSSYLLLEDGTSKLLLE